MNTITYKTTKEFTSKELEDLFLSVEWSSGAYPDKLVLAMRNYGSVFTAWDGDKLVGLISTMDDGVMTAYIHYVLVNPAYQGLGIGRELMRLTTELYKDYLRILLVSYQHSMDFYKSFGFKEGGDDHVTMYLTSLWT